MIGTDAVSLEGKVALVTGAAQGIGQGAAYALAQFGADLAICDRNADSQDFRSWSVRAIPPRIFAILDAEWKSSASTKTQCSASASSIPMVVLPEPDTPITIMIIRGSRHAPKPGLDVPAGRTTLMKSQSTGSSVSAGRWEANPT